MAKTGILIETENDAVKETSLGVMTAAAGQDIVALVLDANPAAVKDKLTEFGAETIVSVKAVSGDISSSPDLAALCLADAAAE